MFAVQIVNMKIQSTMILILLCDLLFDIKISFFSDIPGIGIASSSLDNYVENNTKR